MMRNKAVKKAQTVQRAQCAHKGYLEPDKQLSSGTCTNTKLQAICIKNAIKLTFYGQYSLQFFGLGHEGLRLLLLLSEASVC